MRHIIVLEVNDVPNDALNCPYLVVPERIIKCRPKVVSISAAVLRDLVFVEDREVLTEVSLILLIQQYFHGVAVEVEQRHHVRAV